MQRYIKCRNSFIYDIFYDLQIPWPVKKFIDKYKTDVLLNYIDLRYFSSFSGSQTIFKFLTIVLDVIVSFLCCVYLIFLRDFSTEVRDNRGGAYCYISRYGPHAAVIYVISEVFFGSIRLRTICTYSSRCESIANGRSRFSLHPM